MTLLKIYVDRKSFIQRCYEIWAQQYPGTNCRTLSAEQKADIRERIEREFCLTADEAQMVRQQLLASPDTAELIGPFMDRANAIAAGG